MSVMSGLRVVATWLILALASSATAQVREEVRDIGRPLRSFHQPDFIAEPCAGLLANGSFEAPVLTARFEQPKGIAGWELLRGTEFELQRDDLYGPAADGRQYLELAADQGITIAQTVSTEPGETYLLSFAYSPRPTYERNEVEVRWGGQEVTSLGRTGKGLSAPQWQRRRASGGPYLHGDRRRRHIAPGPGDREGTRLRRSHRHRHALLQLRERRDPRTCRGAPSPLHDALERPSAADGSGSHWPSRGYLPGDGHGR